MRKIRTNAALSVALALLAGCQSPPSRLTRMHMADDQREEARKRWDAMRGGARLQLAEKHLRAGRLDEAMAEAKATIEASPDHPRARLIMARLYLERGELARAREEIGRASQLSKDPDVDYVAGIIAERYDDPATALTCYRAAMEKAGLNVEYLLATAETLVTLKRPTEALELLASRLADFDRSAAVRMLAAKIEQSMGLREPAVEHSAEAMRLSPEDPVMIVEYGLMLAWAERHHEAIAILQPLLDESIRARRQATSQPAEAVPPVGLSPSVHETLARSYIAVGDGAAALRILRAFPEEGDQTLRLLIEVHAATMAGQPQAAIAAVRALEMRGALNADACLMGALAAKRMGDAGSTARFARRALDFDARSTLAHCLIGLAAEAAGRPSEARRAYEAAIALEPDAVLARSLIERLDASGDTREVGAASDGAESRDSSPSVGCNRAVSGLPRSESGEMAATKQATGSDGPSIGIAVRGDEGSQTEASEAP